MEATTQTATTRTATTQTATTQTATTRTTTTSTVACAVCRKTKISELTKCGRCCSRFYCSKFLEIHLQHVMSEV